MELIRYSLFRLNIKPRYFLFDSFYSSEKVIKLLINNNQHFVSQVDKRRNLNHKQVSQINKGRPYWSKKGYLTGNILIKMVKNRKKYFITNDTSLSREEQLNTYKIRWKIEEVFRFTKKKLGLEKCQATTLHAQNTHFGVCFVLYGLLQDIAEKTQMTDYQIKQKATLNLNYAKSLDLMGYFETA